MMEGPKHFSLQSELLEGGYIGEHYRGYYGDTGSLDCGSFAGLGFGFLGSGISVFLFRFQVQGVATSLIITFRRRDEEASLNDVPKGVAWFTSVSHPQREREGERARVSGVCESLCPIRFVLMNGRLCSYHVNRFCAKHFLSKDQGALGALNLMTETFISLNISGFVSRPLISVWVQSSE